MVVATQPQLYTRREAAELLRCCERTVSNLQGRGKLPKVKIGKSIRVPREAVEKYIAEQTTTGISG